MEPIRPEPSRRLVICCDGTWNGADGGEAATNVLRMARAVKSVTAAGTPQIVYYHPGVGTGNGLDKLIGGSTGVGLSRNMRDAYAFIVDNYVSGAEIFLFGFSRGAYTARALAGLIGAIGLLHARDMGGFLDAWAYCRLPKEQRASHKDAFELRFKDRVQDVKIRCIGVWDTVGALGIPPSRPTLWLHKYFPELKFCRSQYQFLDTRLGPHVEHAYQALAINEKRMAFEPAVWQRHAGAPADQVLRQVWFAGVHADIGGGYSEHGAADIALLWMISKVWNLLELEADAIRTGLDTRRVFAADVLHDSFGWFWKPFGAYERHFDTKTIDGEFVHASVLERVRAGEGYTPTPSIDSRRQPIEAYSKTERSFAWEPQDWPSLPPVVTQQQTICNRIVRFLGGG
jgi:uncharacterized protein (DUF2235 family)